MSSTALAQLVQQVGLPLAMFIIIVVSGMRGAWVYGYLYQQERARADRFEALALDLLRTAQAAVSAVERSGAGD